MKKVSQAIKNRYSARYFDKEATITPENYDLIIEAGLRAPSGLGTEPWKFIKVRGDRSKIAASTYNQKAVQDSSEFLVVAYVKEAYLNEEPTFLNKIKESFKEDPAKYLQYEPRIKELVNTNYFREQCIYATSQMVIQASALDIDSLIMGGYDEQALLKDLNIDEKYYGIAIIVAFGYNKIEGHQKEKRLASEVVSEIVL